LRKKEMKFKFMGRWLWCDLCGRAVISCERCGNTSCNGGGCGDGYCHEDFESVTRMGPEELPSKGDIKHVPGLKYEGESR
jgi:hypothetical protein